MLAWSPTEVTAVAIAAAIPIVALQSFNVDPNEIISDSYKYMIVGLLWGVTNPLLRQGAMRSFGPCSSMHHYHTISTATEQQDDSSDGQASDPQPESALTTLKRALLNWKFILFFALNQCGSALHAYLLGAADPALAVPLSNAFTFVFTALTSVALGETPRLGGYTVAGILLVATGAGMCVVAKPSAE